jgi:hypothetical protein
MKQSNKENDKNESLHQKKSSAKQRQWPLILEATGCQDGGLIPVWLYLCLEMAAMYVSISSSLSLLPISKDIFVSCISTCYLISIYYTTFKNVYMLCCPLPLLSEPF